MRQSDLTLLYDYGCWARDRLLATAATLSAEQLLAEVVPQLPSILATIVHTIDAELIWRQRFEGSSMPDTLSLRDLPTLDAARGRWQEEERATRAWLASIDDAALLRTLAYTTKRGVPYAQPLWQLVTHMLNHATQHRSEVAVMLTALGRSPGDLDLIIYLRQ